jgi:hypothetical protein
LEEEESDPVRREVESSPQPTRISGLHFASPAAAAAAAAASRTCPFSVSSSELEAGILE